MGAPKTGNVRNVVLVGQGGVGKTSLAEAMLHLSGTTARLGGHDGPNPPLDHCFVCGFQGDFEPTEEGFKCP